MRLKLPKKLFECSDKHIVQFVACLWNKLSRYWQNGQSLVRRILMLHVMWALIIYVFSVTGLWLSSNYLVEDSLRIQAEHWIDEADALGTRVFVSQRKRKKIRSVEKYVNGYDEISYVHYYSKDGQKLLFDYSKISHIENDIPRLTTEEKDLLSKVPESGRSILYDKSSLDSILRVVSPVHIKAMNADDLMNFDPNKSAREARKTIGYVEIGLDKNHYTDKLFRSIVLGSVVIAVLFFISVFVGRQLILKALMPLSDLKNPLARLASGDTDVQVESTGDEEIAAISEAINATINAVRVRDETLRNLADHDSLTGLVNRSYFSRELDHELALAEGQVKPSALLFIDLDQFKYVNDTLGHAAGDRLLIQVSEALQNRMRDKDTIARFGGDEFTVLARGVDKREAQEVASSVLKLLQEMKFVEGDQLLNIHCSIGVTMIDSHRFSAHELLAQADMACHQAKTAGRNRSYFYEIEEDKKNKMIADMSWSQTIRNAIDNHGFVFCYQPIVSVKGNKCEYYEVLLRLPGKDELILPSAFLPAAERFGLMVEVDKCVISHAFLALSEYKKQGRIIKFSINISSQTFEDSSLIKFVREELKKNNISGSDIIFEITEQTAIKQLSRSKMIVRNLKALGCTFSLDNFGAGFSSLGYLKHVPIDYIKIDGTFIERLAKDTVDQTMVKSVVQIAKALGKQTVAEYVQDDETVRILKKIGVDYFQGNLIGKPETELPCCITPPEKSESSGS